jgi:hypothetical protein
MSDERTLRLIELARLFVDTYLLADDKSDPVLGTLNEHDLDFVLGAVIAFKLVHTRNAELALETRNVFIVNYKNFCVSHGWPLPYELTATEEQGTHD